jgi:hypothetical protein
MAVEDYLESEVAVAAAATAALLSPRVRGVMRKGLVYGTAGVMTAGDAVVSGAKGVGRGAQRVVGRGGDGARAEPGRAQRVSRARPAARRQRSEGARLSGAQAAPEAP